MGAEGGSAAVLTTARLIHPEHAELLCLGYWLQVKFEDWIRSWLWLRTIPLCTVLDKTYQLSRKIISHPLHCPFLLAFALGPCSPQNYIAFNQEEMTASFYFAHYYQTKGSGDFAASEGFNYSKAVLAPVVCAPWLHLLSKSPMNDLL